MNSKIGNWVSGVLTIVGALNWGAVGIFGVNPVHELSGRSRLLERLIYTTVGLAGIFLAFSFSRGQSTASEVRQKVEQRRPVGVV